MGHAAAVQAAIAQGMAPPAAPAPIPFPIPVAPNDRDAALIGFINDQLSQGCLEEHV